jgi:uncharacterized cupin superfamily protein
MLITEVYADAVGATHFREISIVLKSRDFAPPSAPIGVSPETPMTTGAFLELPPGWDPSYHSTPRRQWVIVLHGHLKITVTDGTVTDFRSGDVFFLNDENSSGHQTVVQGQQSAVVLLVGLAD